MLGYEIKLYCAETGKLNLSAKQCYFSDFAAIRAALGIARATESLEIWRDEKCIYRIRRSEVRT